jgi:hypothetical protein
MSICVVALIVEFSFVIFQSHVCFLLMCNYGTSLSSLSTAAAGHVSTIQILLTCLPLRPCIPSPGSHPAKPMSDAARAHQLFVAAACSGITAEVSCARLIHGVSLSGYQRMLLKINFIFQDADGRWSPLHFSVLQRQPIATKLLLIHGADPTARLGTALKSACEVALKTFKVGMLAARLARYLSMHLNSAFFKKVFAMHYLMPACQDLHQCVHSQSSTSNAEPCPAAQATTSRQQTEIAAKVLSALFQDGCSDKFLPMVPSLHNLTFGSDFCFCVLAAVWARNSTLIEAFLRLVKVELKACDEFCGSLPETVGSPNAAAAVPSSMPTMSIGTACLHAAVELGYYEGSLIFLNFGVPVDSLCPAAPIPVDRDDLLARSCTALEKIAMSDVPQQIILNIAGLLISHGADVSFLSNAACSSSTAASTFRKNCVSINSFVRSNSSNGRFRPPFVHTSAAVATRDSITKMKSASCCKHLVCQCRSGLCQLSRAAASPRPCPCLTEFRDPAYRVEIPPFWNHAHMSVSGIERCVSQLGVDDMREHCDDNVCGSVGIMLAADAMCEELEPLVAMKTGWTVIESDKYAGEVSLGVGDKLILAGVVAMMGGLARFIDSYGYGGNYGVAVGRPWIKAMKRSIRQEQEQSRCHVAFPASLAWLLMQLEDKFFKEIARKLLPEHVRCMLLKIVYCW